MLLSNSDSCYFRYEAFWLNGLNNKDFSLEYECTSELYEQ